MPIRLYDSLARDVVDFVPLTPGQVSMYVCGPTVQSEPHIGHLRSALVYDLWWRWMEYRGLDVTMVRNVTDIDDKILEKARDTNEQWWQLASRVEREFHKASDAIGIRRPASEPRATGDIPAMLSLIERLIDRGHAYVADDGSGDVYFDVASWSRYGELTRQKPEDMEPGEASTGAKRSVHDFALWKGHKEHEPETAAWPAPWGRGRPGWHLECSAMAARYLGPTFDIHGGGLDLRFPHHENELAQSAAAGDDFARHWVHSALVLVNGQKMSKSLGNSIFAGDWLEKARPIVIRYALSAAHYRSDIDLHDGALEEAEKAFSRIEGFVERTRDLPEAHEPLPEAFSDAMDDDLGIPEALGVLHETVRRGNHAVDDGDTSLAAQCRSEVVAMLDVLGLNPHSAQWAAQSGSADSGSEHLDTLVQALLDARKSARESKDFGLADQIRDVLQAGGIDVTDTADGPQWSIRGS
ncbi:cysteinyl-tRNA synthetase [Pontimonas salivibrio]|uniref:Cysteine--tRNA ligase n=1 Tax=Pontimonas salivibrio TaxID=1159327 RepID=A0A2L2BSN7_9MICO|nr:cysteine--tRNA ligase [Pontimonas salivibrio]AVG24632.1 cysteinyl-tRNA synthetase [Pontimonas salivibrio]